MSRGFSRGGGGYDRGRGGSGGFRGGSGRGGGRGGYQPRDFGPPSEVQEIGAFLHPVESEMLCTLSAPTKIPYFNAPIYLANKTQIGKVDEILGPINEVYFTVKMDSGMQAASFKKDDKVFIGGDKLLPIERFLPKPTIPGAKPEKRGGARGGRGGMRGRGGPPGRGGGRGFSRGGPPGRGGFASRGFGGSRGGPPRGRGGFRGRGG